MTSTNSAKHVGLRMKIAFFFLDKSQRKSTKEKACALTESYHKATYYQCTAPGNLGQGLEPSSFSKCQVRSGEPHRHCPEGILQSQLDAGSAESLALARKCSRRRHVLVLLSKVTEQADSRSGLSSFPVKLSVALICK
ncbi:Atp-Dependent Translocase Abcb1 [Manis pentadactyla]|nr:Atp-Dependent Translocase Abcb1 [Manis pentadactyla]